LLSLHHKKFEKIIFIIIALILLVLTPAKADRLNSFSLGISNSVIITQTQALQDGVVFTVRIQGDSPGKIVAEIVDIYVDSSNSKMALPLGQTPYTPQGFVTIEQNEIDYVPSDEFQNIEIKLKFENIDDLDRSLIGGLKVAAYTDEELSRSDSIEGISVQVNALGTFSYLPAGVVGIESDLILLESKFEYARDEFILYKLIPDLSFLLNSNKILQNYQVKNEGNIALSATSNINIYKLRLNPFNREARELVFDYQSEPKVLLPSQSDTNSVPLAYVDDSTEIRYPALDPIGIYRVETLVEGKVVSDLLSATNTDKVLIIFPWKIFVYVIIFLLFRAYVKTRRSRKLTHLSEHQFLESVEMDKTLDLLLNKSLESKNLNPKVKKPGKKVAAKKSIAAKKKSVSVKRKPAKKQIATKKPVAKKRITKKAPVEKRVKARV
jgi:hypothetical protein